VCGVLHCWCACLLSHCALEANNIAAWFVLLAKHGITEVLTVVCILLTG
jgi:hypothetical protein